MFERASKPMPGRRPIQRRAAATRSRSAAQPTAYERGKPASARGAPAGARVGFAGLSVHPPRADRDALPAQLKSGIEALSGVSMEGVSVRYNSPRPAGLGALAFARGREIHLGAGQAHHLPHEAWHLVQQAQGRVRPNLRLNGGVAANDDRALEREADRMGARALAAGRRIAPAGGYGTPQSRTGAAQPLRAGAGDGPVQCFWPFTDAHAPPVGIGERVGALRGALRDSGAQEQADPHWYAQQQTHLHRAEADIHAWLRDHGHHATDAQRREMAGHLYALEDHHAELVGVQQAHAHPLWLPEDASQQHRAQAGQVWASISQGAGNIQVPAGGATRRNTLADVSKLLQRPHGLAMLQELDAQQHGANRGIRIGADWSAEFGQTGREHQAGAWATPIPADTNLHQRDYDGAARAGIGSYVQVPRGPRAMETGEHGNTGVPMPHYLTLGHELGHAVNNLRGQAATQEEHNPGYNALSRMDKMLWSDAEEHQNITVNENAIRDEHGLPRRAYHRPPEAVRMTHMRDRLIETVERARTDFPEHERLLDTIDPIMPGFAETLKQGGTPAHYEQAQARISSLYRNRNLKRGALALGGLGLAAGAYALLRGRWR